jgi:hypothetical protein
MGMSKSDWTNIVMGFIALVGVCAAYLALGKADRGTFVMVVILAIVGVLNVAALIRNLHDAHRAKNLRAEHAKQIAELESIGHLHDAEHEKQVAKLDSELCKARADVLEGRSRKLGYVNAGALQVLARQAEGLRLCLIDLCGTAMAELSSVPEELGLPLNPTKTPENQWEWTHRFAWKFQRDFIAHKLAVEFEVIANFTSPVMGLSVPSNVAVDKLIGALDTHHTLLLQRINRLLD